MDGWVVCMCAMMLAALLFVGRADVCVDGCRTGSCIDVGWVNVRSEVVLDFANSFSEAEKGRRGGRMGGWMGGREDWRRVGGWEHVHRCWFS